MRKTVTCCICGAGRDKSRCVQVAYKGKDSWACVEHPGVVSEHEEWWMLRHGTLLPEPELNLLRIQSDQH